VAANNPKHGVPHETTNDTAERIARSAADESQESIALTHLTSSSSGGLQPTITAVHTLTGDLSTYVVYIKANKPETADHQIVAKITTDLNRLSTTATREGLIECANPE
jgi:hypothetical protein